MKPYTIQEWIEDYALAARLTLEPGATAIGVKQKERDHFYSKYQGVEAIDHFARFYKAMQFLDQHVHKLSFGRAAVAGERALLVAEPFSESPPRAFHVDSARTD